MDGKTRIWRFFASGLLTVMPTGDLIRNIGKIVVPHQPTSIHGSTHWGEWPWGFVSEGKMPGYGRTLCHMMK